LKERKMLTIVLTLFLQSGPIAHAHNDYLHPRPLLDALQHGFTSVEADIFLGEGDTLLVAHTRAEIKPDRTLQKLYLDPLRERVKQQGGKVQPGSVRFYLFIDLKTDAATTWPALRAVLAQYVDILTEVRDGSVTERAVTVILSGSRPSLATLGRESPRFAAYDGRLSDLESDAPAHLLPVISDNWMSTFRWGASIPFSEKDSARLKEMVAKAHAKGRMVRFWATPEKELAWKTLLEHGVDMLNTDKLAELSGFLGRRGR
jgi:Glycerophosphoryl diester phosphodiesterase family